MRVYVQASERWEIELHDERVVTRRFFANELVDDRTSLHASPLRAKWEADRFCSGLGDNGYARVAGEIVPLGKCELEEALRANPDDLATYLVYADWLSEHGDDWGQLIAIQHALQTLPRHMDKALRQETAVRKDELSRMETMLRYRLGSGLFGVLGETLWNESTQTYLSDLIDATWDCGFLRGASVRASNPEVFETIIKTLNQLPIALVLRSLHINDADDWPGGTIETLVERPWPLLELVGVHAEGGRLEAARLVPLLANAPKLAHLLLTAATTGTDVLCDAIADSPLTLKSLTIQMGTFTDAGISALRRMRGLQKLQLTGSMPGDTHARLRAIAPDVRVVAE